jgi:drug/metabolite transporter (DMT)-like permease
MHNLGLNGAITECRSEKLMPLIALVFIAVSALLQASLNVPIKGSERKVAFTTVGSLLSLIFYFPLFMWGRFLLGEHAHTLGLWSWVGIMMCGLMGAVYYLFIGGAYDQGDLSLVFPITRGFGPIFILIFALIWLNEKITYLGLLGIMITVFGSYVINLPSFKFSDLFSPFKAFKSKTFLFSMGAGACTATYTLFNKKNLQLVEPFTLQYLIFCFMTGILIISLLLKNTRHHINLELKHNWRNLSLFGVFNFISSALVLYALKMSKVSYLGAARNISVVFSVILGCFFLKEGYGRIRFFASALIFAGIFLLAVS